MPYLGFSGPSELLPPWHLESVRLGKSKSTVWPGAPGVLLDPWQVLSRRVLNRTLVYQINREEPLLETIKKAS